MLEDVAITCTMVLLPETIEVVKPEIDLLKVEVGLGVSDDEDICVWVGDVFRVVPGFGEGVGVGVAMGVEVGVGEVVGDTTSAISEKVCIPFHFVDTGRKTTNISWRKERVRPKRGLNRKQSKPT
jgi:hypothetical protein